MNEQELCERLEGLEAQREADDRTFESSTLDMGGFSLDRGKTIVVHAAAMLTAQDLGGAMAACRTMRRVVPQAVYALDGLNPSVLTDYVLNATLRRFSFISTIDLTGCHKLQDVEAWPSDLTTVHLSRCFNLTDGAVEALASHCPGLTTVNLSRCSNLTDGAVEALASHCPELTSVNLSRCSKLTDDAVEVLASHCRGLTTVDLSDCRNLTDSAVEALASHCPGLTTVDLTCCRNLTDGAVEALASHCWGLTTVNLGGCRNLTDGAVKALKALISQRGGVLTWGSTVETWGNDVFVSFFSYHPPLS